MSTATPEEQLMLELINRARVDPYAEMQALFNTGQSNIDGAVSFFANNADLLDDGLNNDSYTSADLEAQALSEVLGLPSVAPLAWNDNLATSADTHNDLMISFDQQSHSLPGEPGYVARFTAGGYDLSAGWGIGENIYGYTKDPLHGHAGYYIDWGFTSTGIQNPAGHRDSILSSNFKEVGIAYAAVPAGQDLGPYSTTQHFGYSSNNPSPYILGVAIDDLDDDDFYDIGEGLSGITVTATGTGGTFSTTSWTAGGYQLAVAPNSTYTVTFSGAGIGSTQSFSVTVGSDNIKLDVEKVDAPTTDTPTSGDDNLVGTSADDVINGLAGNDTIDGGLGNDELIGGLGDDLLLSSLGADTLHGGGGIDTGDYSASNAGVTIGINNGAINVGGHAEGDVISTITENLIGSGFDDQITGNTLQNVLTGGAGNDTMNGGSNDDTVEGGDGNDLLIGSSGADSIDGGAGVDTGSWGNSGARVIVDLVAGTAIGSGHGPGDTLTNIENVIGSKFDDTLNGDGGNNALRGLTGDDVMSGAGGDDTLLGAAGNDALDGGDGADFLVGGNDNDTLDGGAGSDTLNAGAGNDTLTGGTGADDFYFSRADFGVDTITDYEDGIDTFDFTAFGPGFSFADLTVAYGTFDSLIYVTDDPANVVTLEGITSGIDASDFIFDEFILAG